MEKYQIDILVIGGGLAGLAAAIQGASGQSNVLIASKGKVGCSGNTIVSTGCLAGYIAGYDTLDSPEQFRQDILKAGEQINDKTMVEVFVEKSGESLLMLERWGINFLRDGKRLINHSSPGHTRPRVYQAISQRYPYSLQGMNITSQLREIAQKKGVKFLEGVSMYSLAKNHGQIAGAWGIKRDGTPISIQAKAVIIASGGCGHIFANNNNTNDITGDSYSLAQGAGATLRDMEFMQFYPTMMLKPYKLAITTTLFSHCAVLRNSEDEVFIDKYDSLYGHMSTRDVMARAIFNEVREGRGIEGGVYLDCTAIPEKMFKNSYPTLYKALIKGRINPSKDKIVVKPVAHFFMGGISTDKVGRTGVPGLWATGESVGGLHGANRLSSNALTEALVFGTLAGQDAQLYCQNNRSMVPMDMGAATISKGLFNPKGDSSLREVINNLKNLLWQEVAIIRTEDGLSKALQKVQGMASSLNHIKIYYPQDIYHYLGLKNSLITAQEIIKAALARQESRGTHYRSDYPAKDNLLLEK